LVAITRRGFLAGALSWSMRHLEAQISIPQKTLDKRVASEVGEYAIGFSSEKSTRELGHAFVVWYYSNPKGLKTVRRGGGFYPVSDNTTKEYDMILGVSGSIDDDSKKKLVSN
jgi:hypothetical protein